MFAQNSVIRLDIYSLIRKVYGSDTVSCETICRWKEFGRPVTATGKANVLKVRETFESDGRCTILDTVKAVGI